MRDNFASAVRLPNRKVPAVIKHDIAPMPAESALSRAIQALAECLTFDQARDIADEAKAIARYAAEKKGAEELLRMARQIQVRAYRRMGELLKNWEGEKFHPVSAEATSIRIAEMEPAAFEAALAADPKGMSPHEFAQTHLRRPPPIYNSDPVSIARRNSRMARRFAQNDPELNRFKYGIRQLLMLIEMPAHEFAAKVIDKDERKSLKDQARRIADWLDELERRLARRS